MLQWVVLMGVLIDNLSNADGEAEEGERGVEGRVDAVCYLFLLL